MNQFPPPPPSPGSIPPPYPGQAPKTESLATAALVLGISSFVCLGCLGGVPAIICGHLARGKIRDSHGQLDGAGMALAGLILGYLSIVFTIAVAVIYGVFLAKAVPQIQSGATPAIIEEQASQLKTGLDLYKANTGSFPKLTGTNGEIVDTAALVKVLGATSPTGSPYYKPGEQGLQANGLPVDLWLQPLHIAIDLNGDGFVQVGSQKIPGTVAVWSSGPDKKDTLGNGDDLTSWAGKSTPAPLER